MVTSFADGTKISFEQAIVANATGMTIGKRGMFGPTVPSGTPLKEIMSKYPLDVLTSGPGIVDYCVGAEPGPGVFVLGTHDHPQQKHYLNLYKLGEGPLYLFYTPYHLCHFVTPGITGYAQVNGFRGETKEVGLMEKRVEYDVNYMENWSLSLDIKIIFLTVWNMVSGEKSAY